MRFYQVLFILISFIFFPVLVQANDWEVSVSPGHPFQCVKMAHNGEVSMYVNSKYGFRCEMGNHSIVNYPWGTTHDIDFTIYIPDDWKVDKNGFDSLFQAWQQPDSCDPSPARGVPLTVGIEGKNLIVVAKTDSDRCAGFKPGKRYVLNEVIPGGIYNFKIQVRWHLAFGKLHVLLNDNEVINYTGGMGFNDEAVPVYSFGIYTWKWRKDRPPGTVRRYGFTIPIIREVFR